jgi:hypothetical protein
MVIVTLSVDGDAPGDDVDVSGGETTRQEGVVGRRKNTLAKKPAANTMPIKISRMSYLLRKYSISIAYSKSVHCNNKGDYPTGLNPQYEHNEPGMPTPKSYYTGKSLTAVRKRCIQWPQSNVESHTKLHPFLVK